MSRGIGEFGPIQDTVPEWAAVLVALLTQLGDVWFIVLLLTTLYVFEAADRDDIAVVVGLWLAGTGLYRGLKEIFALPRPDQPLLDPELLPWMIEPLYAATATATGYGFPSGHAVGTTIVYVALAHVLEIGTRRRRFAVAAVVVATVSLSRVALGVHYLVDVVAGVAVGAGLLLASYGLMRRRLVDRPTFAFGLAVVLAGFYLAVSGVDGEAFLLGAGALGAFAGWQLVVICRRLARVDRPPRATRSLALRGGAAALAVVAPTALAVGYFPPFSVHTVAGAVGLAATVLVAAPFVRRSACD